MVGRKHEWRSRISRYGEEAPDQLLAHPLNWRLHGKDQQSALAGVLESVGVVQNVIVNERTGHVVDGHLRITLALRSGQSTIPVTYVDLDESEEALILATLDPIAALASQDDVNLADLLAMVETDNAAVQALLDSLSGETTITAGLTDPDDVPAVPDEPVTKPGDLWLLGRHRLLCGDATVITDVERLMGGERADMVFTDPPYAVYGSSTGVGSDVADDKMIRPFFRDILSAMGISTKAWAHLYVCCDWRSWPAWCDMAKTVRLQVKNCIVWDKGSPALGSMFRSQHEFVMFATNSWQSTVNMTGAKTGQRTVTTDANVWKVNRPTDKEHNAAKPIELIDHAIQGSSDVDDLILDLFGGSGSTLIACEQTGRRCAMMEIDPHYVDVICERFYKFSGINPVREDGVPWNETKAIAA